MSNRSPLHRALRNTAFLMLLIVGSGAVVGRSFSIGRTVVVLLVIGAMAYVKERLPWHLPKVRIMVGMMALLIYGWIFYTDGIPEDPRVRVVWALLVSLPLIVVVMAVHTMWIVRRCR